MLYETLTEENRSLLDKLLPTYRLKGRDLERAPAWCVNVLHFQFGAERRSYSDEEINGVVKNGVKQGSPWADENQKGNHGLTGPAPPASVERHLLKSLRDRCS